MDVDTLSIRCLCPPGTGILSKEVRSEGWVWSYVAPGFRVLRPRSRRAVHHVSPFLSLERYRVEIQNGTFTTTVEEISERENPLIAVTTVTVLKQTTTPAIPVCRFKDLSSPSCPV